jgi:hypothetical protein
MEWSGNTVLKGNPMIIHESHWSALLKNYLLVKWLVIIKIVTETTTAIGDSTTDSIPLSIEYEGEVEHGTCIQSSSYTWESDDSDTDSSNTPGRMDTDSNNDPGGLNIDEKDDADQLAWFWVEEIDYDVAEPPNKVDLDGNDPVPIHAAKSQKSIPIPE